MQYDIRKGVVVSQQDTRMNDRALVNIWDGYTFFKKWLDKVYEQGVCVCVSVGECVPVSECVPD